MFPKKTTRPKILFFCRQTVVVSFAIYYSQVFLAKFVFSIEKPACMTIGKYFMYWCILDLEEANIVRPSIIHMILALLCFVVFIYRFRSYPSCYYAGNGVNFTMPVTESLRTIRATGYHESISNSCSHNKTKQSTTQQNRVNVFREILFKRKKLWSDPIYDQR